MPSNEKPKVRHSFLPLVTVRLAVGSAVATRPTVVPTPKFPNNSGKQRMSSGGSAGVTAGDQRGSSGGTSHNAPPGEFGAGST
jgi:hypothetical protein